MLMTKFLTSDGPFRYIKERGVRRCPAVQVSVSCTQSLDGSPPSRDERLASHRLAVVAKPLFRESPCSDVSRHFIGAFSGRSPAARLLARARFGNSIRSTLWFAALFRLPCGAWCCAQCPPAPRFAMQQCLS